MPMAEEGSMLLPVTARMCLGAKFEQGIECVAASPPN